MRLFYAELCSSAWFRRHSRDPYVKAAREEGYRARSAYKLIEIDDRHRLLRSGMGVVECGAAPGAWTQVTHLQVNTSTFIYVCTNHSHVNTGMQTRAIQVQKTVVGRTYACIPGH